MFTDNSFEENTENTDIDEEIHSIKDNITEENSEDYIEEEIHVISVDNEITGDALSDVIKETANENTETISAVEDSISDSDDKIVDKNTDSAEDEVIDDLVSDTIEEAAYVGDEVVFTENENSGPRHIVISADASSFESGLEIKYTSLQLRNFPIKYKNFSEKMDFDEIVNIGTTSIKIGDTIIHNAVLKILVYSKFKLLEMKTREFKLALSIELNDEQTLVKKDDYFKYEIYDKVKTSRLNEVVEIFKKIFSGEKITFKYNQLMGDISFENRLEVYKFNIISETIEGYKNITKELSLYKEKNINDTKDSFYSLFLLNAYLKDEKLSNWVNFRIKNNYNILPGDILSFEKIHKLKLHGITFDLKEHVKLVDPISTREINERNEICCYRKAVEITLEKTKKSDMKR
ncbi:hypothetical protein [Fusobacterium ulcerans]|uniref:hypothetical protein n=1 Tax=Fusobacterium ulcerans TaxID=861 RepID=UPI0026F1B364|nr:hypothetical protein [Fusobacterium ulcerans]